LQVVSEPEGVDIVAYPCDISNREDVLRMGTQILEKFGKVENESLEQIEAVMRTNYFGMVYCTKVFLKPCFQDTQVIL
jgi:uncharacterized protein